MPWPENPHSQHSLSQGDDSFFRDGDSLSGGGVTIRKEAFKNPDIGWVFFYIIGGYSDLLRLRLSEKPHLINTQEETTGLYPLHLAIGLDKIEIAALLISLGAGFFPDARGRRPSIIAIECKVSDAMLDLVLEAEARFDHEAD